MWQTWTWTHHSQSLPVLKIGLLKIKILLHYMAAPNQRKAICSTSGTNFFSFPEDVLFCQSIIACFCKSFWFIYKTLSDLLWEFAHNDFYIYLMHLVVDSYGIFQIGYTVAVTPVLLCCPGCCLPAESIWCLLFSVCLKLSVESQTIFKTVHFMGLIWCVCEPVFLSMSELRF